MVNVSELEVNDFVQIQDNTDWHNNIGIVKYKNEGVAYLVTVQNPCYLYELGIWNAENCKQMIFN